MNLMARRRALMGAGNAGITENFVRVGNPTIVNGIMTTSLDGWIKLPFVFSPMASDKWELVIKTIRTGRDGFQNILSSPGVILQSKGGATQPYIYLKSSGAANWDISNGNYYANVLFNQWTWVKILYDTSRYEILTSIDGINYTSNHSFAKRLALNPGTFKIGEKASNTSPVQGQYDLNEAYLKLNGEIWWKAYE